MPDAKIMDCAAEAARCLVQEAGWPRDAAVRVAARAAIRASRHGPADAGASALDLVGIGSVLTGLGWAARILV